MDLFLLFSSQRPGHVAGFNLCKFAVGSDIDVDPSYV